MPSSSRLGARSALTELRSCSICSSEACWRPGPRPKRVQDLADLVDVAQRGLPEDEQQQQKPRHVLDVELLDDGSTLRPAADGDQSLGLEKAQRLAHSAAPDTELLAHLRL